MKKFYLLSLFLIGMGLVAPAFSANAQATDGEAAGTEAEATTVTADPMPGFLEGGLPTTIKFTFSKEIAAVNWIMVRCGWSRGDELSSDCYSLDESKKVLTVNIPEENVLGQSDMTVSMEAIDTDGNCVTEGRMPDQIMMSWETTLPSNTYECTPTSPVDGMSVGKLDKFELAFVNPFDEFDFIGGWDASKKIVVKDANGEVVATATDLDVKMDEWDWFTGVLTFTLDRTIDEAGNYTLEVPEAMVYNSLYYEEEADFGVANGAIYNPAQYFIFTVSEVKVDNEPGEYAESLPETITLTFPQEINSVENIILVTQYGDLRGTNIVDMEGVYTIDGNTVTLNLPAEMLAGNEQVEVSLEVIGADGMAYAYNSYGSNINLSYTTDLPDDRFACVPNPSTEEVQEELSVIELAFVNPALAEDVIGNDLETQTLDVLDENGVVITTAQLSIKESDEFNTNVVVAKLKNKIRGLGKYSITIPEKLVYNSFYNPWVEDFGTSDRAIYNPETTLVYTIAEPDGIESVNAANAKATIYNVAGQKLRETNVNNLGRGVYIVNGKKVVVK